MLFKMEWRRLQSALTICYWCMHVLTNSKKGEEIFAILAHEYVPDYIMRLVYHACIRT